MAEIENNDTGPGELLKAARKSIGLSKADIARQLNLSQNLIGQLEANEYKDDIPDAFLRGYIRTYARLIDLDEEEIVALYSKLTGSSSVGNIFVPSNDAPPIKMQIGNHLLWFKVLSFGVVISIFILGWLAFTQNNETKPSRSTTSKPFKETSLLDNQATALLPMSTGEDEPKQDNPKSLEKQPSITSSLHFSQDFSDQAILTDAELEFTFIEDCWVQVTDSNNEVLAVGLKSAGRRFFVSGVPPITIVLGKPRAINLQYNNQAVDLSIYPASQPARFILGKISLVEEVLADTQLE